jgi:hypothetical protein
VEEGQKAVTYGYDAKAADQLVARAKEQMRREDLARKKAEAAARERAELARREKEEREKAEAEAKAKAEVDAKAAEATAASGQPAATAAATPAVPSEDARRSSQQHYLSGVIFFQKGDYEKAREEWTLSLQLDPGNSDARAGLERIEKLYGGGR